MVLWRTEIAILRNLQNCMCKILDMYLWSSKLPLHFWCDFFITFCYFCLEHRRIMTNLASKKYYIFFYYLLSRINSLALGKWSLEMMACHLLILPEHTLPYHLTIFVVKWISSDAWNRHETEPSDRIENEFLPPPPKKKREAMMTSQ